MQINGARELLDALLEGKELHPSELGMLLGLKEGQYLDFKDGLITEESRLEHGKRKIRKYVSGFANADGGILVVGISEEKPRKISPCASVGPGGLAAWAKDVVSDMAPFLIPPPRFQVVEGEDGPVLLIAIARAPQLVICTESRRAKYFLRIHDSMVEVPEYLATDLFLGRRQQPSIDLSFRPSVGPPGPQYVPTFYFIAENVGLLAAEEIEAGFVCWSWYQDSAPLNRQLLSHLDIQEPSNEWGLLHTVIRQPMGEPFRLPPFSSQKSLFATGYEFRFSSCKCS